MDITLIKKPVITEKSRVLKDRQNTYTFLIDRRLTKSQIKGNIERMFNVKVEKVNTLIRMAKMRRFGRFLGYRTTYKKAYVTLKKGHEIKPVEATL